MSGELPTSEVEAVDNGLGTIARPSTQIAVFLGPAADGPFEPRVVTLSTIESLYRAGPMMKKAAYSMVKTRRKAICVRLPKATKSAAVSAVDDTDIAGTAVPTVTGTPTGVYEFIVEIILGGTIGTGPITYRVSKDGGETFGSNVSLGTATTFVVTGTGLTVHLTATHTFVTSDSFTFSAIPASDTILAQTTTRVDASTSTMTAAGEPEDDYEVVVECTIGGTANSSGNEPTIRYSLDGERTWSAARKLVGLTLVLLDGKSYSSGITVTFGAGTLDALDRLEFGATAPHFSTADFDTAVSELDSMSLQWSFLVLATGLLGLTPAEVASLGSSLDDLETAQRFTMLVGSARPHMLPETMDVWEGRIPPSFDLTVNNRVTLSGSAARIKCPLTSRQNRRPWSWVRVPRILKGELAEDEGRKKSGALSSDVRIHDDNGALVEVDARFRPTAWDHRLTTATTYRGEIGTVYPTESRMLHAAAGDDIVRVPMRRVQDVASTIFQSLGQQELVDQLEQQNAADGDPNPGALKPYDAKRIETTYRGKLEAALAGQMSALEVVVDRTDTDFGETGIIRADLNIVSLVWVLGFRGNVRYVPADEIGGGES